MADDAPAPAAPTPTPGAPVVSAPVKAAMPATDAAPQTFDLTLREFCLRQSSVPGNSVEMLAAFHHAETRAGTVKDAHANFSSRYADFANQPA
jgi:hypothetical protein